MMTHSRNAKTLFALAALAVLAACVSPTTTEPTATKIAGDDPPISATRAVSLLTQVCGASLPQFRSAPAKFAAIGPVVKSQTGIIHSGREDVSFKISDGPGAGKNCSLVFSSNDGTAAVLKALAQYAPIAKTGLGPTTMYQKRALTFLAGAPRKLNNRTYYNIRMLSER